MTNNEAMHLLDMEINALKDMIAYNKEFEPKNDNRNLTEKITAFNLAKKALDEVRQYREIGTVKECREAREKQEPMKVTDVHTDEYYCPACGAENGCDDGSVGDTYCPNCGHKLKG